MSGEIEKPLAIASAQGHVLALYGYSALYSYSALYGLDCFIWVRFFFYTSVYWINCILRMHIL